MRIELLAAMLPESEGSIPLLGATVEGRWSTVVGAFAAAAVPATERVAKAEAACTALRWHVAAHPDENITRSTHVIPQTSYARALCYDLRVNP